MAKKLTSIDLIAGLSTLLISSIAALARLIHRLRVMGAIIGVGWLLASVFILNSIPRSPKISHWFKNGTFKVTQWRHWTRG